jgi:DNA repair photolyase
MIPGLTDSPAAIESVIKAAKLAGASEVWWRSLFLKPAAARRFVPFIEDRFPGLAPRIEEFYARATYVPRVYDDKLAEVFDRLRRKHGFGVKREEDAMPPHADRTPRPRPSFQLSLSV